MSGPERLDEPEFEAMRSRLGRRFAATLAALCAALTALRWERGWLLRSTMGAVIALLIWEWRALRPGRPAAGRLRPASALLLSLLLLVWVQLWSGGGLAPVLAAGAGFGLLFHLCAGAAAGWTAYGAFLLGTAQALLLKGSIPLPELSLAMDLVLAASALQFTAVTYGRTFGLLRQEAGRRRAQLDAETQARHGLVRALLEEMEAPLRAPLAPGEDLHPRLAALREGLRHAGQLRMALQTGEEMDVDLRISRHLLPPLLGLCAGMAVAIGLRDALLGEPWPWVGPLAAAALGLLAWLVLRGRMGWEPVARGSVAVGLAAVAVGAVSETGRLPHALAYGALVIVFAGLWLGLRAALAVGAALAALLAWSWGGRGLALPPNEMAMAWNYAALWCMLAFVIAPAALWQQGLLTRLQRQQFELAEGLRVRRRLLGTLHHDAANLVQAMDAAAVLGQEPSFARLAGRLSRLIGSARFWLFGEQAFRPEQLLTVRLLDAATDQGDVFGGRLRGKGLGLELDVPPSLAVRCLPGVLVDGVIGNLVSNAIKFAPPGSALRLRAWQQDGRACLAVCDAGAGFTPAQLERFESGGELASTLGTRGEAGQGLGLGLAAEHLRRMGGRLELLNPPGGGAEARVWLPLA